MSSSTNPVLYEVVRKLYDELVVEFGSEDCHSANFLSSFPYSFLNRGFDETDERRKPIVEAALLPQFRTEAEKAIEACYANCSGGDLESYTCDAVEDFLNYIIPRTIALPNAIETFDRFYREFDSSLYTKSCLITVNAVIRDLSDHTGGMTVLPTGFRFMWLAAFPGPMNVPYTRERGVTFLEIRKRGHPIGFGRSLEGDNAFNVLQYVTRLPKRPDILGQAYQLTERIVAHFLLAARIKTYSTAHCDYRGFRILGNLSTHSMLLHNFPDERIERGEHRDVDESSGMAIDRLLTKLLPQNPDNFAVINQKLEDAIRRRRSTMLNQQRGTRLNEIDQLLDYVQVLEAIVPVMGSESISLYAARLLTRHDSPPNQGFELYTFIKDMYKIRNAVVHGRVNEILDVNSKLAAKLDIPRFRQIIYSLTCLHIMNGQLRGDLATRLSLGEKIELEREYETNPVDWMKRHKEARLRNANTVFW